MLKPNQTKLNQIKPSQINTFRLVELFIHMYYNELTYIVNLGIHNYSEVQCLVYAYV